LVEVFQKLFQKNPNFFDFHQLKLDLKFVHEDYKLQQHLLSQKKFQGPLKLILVKLVLIEVEDG